MKQYLFKKNNELFDFLAEVPHKGRSHGKLFRLVWGSQAFALVNRDASYTFSPNFVHIPNKYYNSLKISLSNRVLVII